MIAALRQAVDSRARGITVSRNTGITVGRITGQPAMRIGYYALICLYEWIANWIR